MNLTVFKNLDKSLKMTMLLSITFTIILAVTFTIAFVYLTKKVDAAYTKALVLDTSGNVYNATSVHAADMRKYEYENHIKQFVQKWYSFDEHTYEQNVIQALYWIGDTGKELLNEYNDVNMLHSLVQKNLRYTVSMKEIKVDMKTVPVTGYIIFSQTGFRAKGSIARDIYAQFSLYDVSRASENPHGVKIDQWIVKYSEPRETTREEEKTGKTKENTEYE